MVQKSKVLAQIAVEAGDLLASLQAPGLVRKPKLGVDFVTEADLRSQELSIARLEASFPGIPIVAEEQEAPGIEFEEFFTVDPLDGTRIYAEGCSEYGTALTYFERSSPQAAVIYQPACQRLLRIERGLGCFLNELPLSGLSDHVPAHSVLGADLVLTHRLNDQLRLVNVLAHRFSVVRCLNAAVAGTAELLMGRTVAYVNAYCFIWDAAPGALAVELLGGTVSDLRGFPIDWRTLEKDILFASSDTVRDEILGALSN